MKAQVLSLARRPDRLNRFMGWNHAHGLDFTIMPAMDGRTLNRADLVAQNLLHPDHALFTDGAVGAALSHRAQWQACIEEGLPRLILEDDACLRHGFAAHAQGVLAALGQADMVFLGYNTDAPLTLLVDEGMFSAVYFHLPARDAAAFQRYAHQACALPRPGLFTAALVWGALAYAVTPKGARLLLERCFPLRAVGVHIHAEKRVVQANGIDGLMNWAIQQGGLRAQVCYPPLAIGPNDMSDVQP